MPPDARHRSRSGYVLVVLSALTAAATGVVAALAFDGGVTPAEVAAIRVYGGALTLGLVALGSLRLLRRRDLPILAAFGVIALMIGPGSAFQAISRMDIALVLVIVFTAPLVVAVYERLRHGERLPAYAYWAMAIAVGGVAMTVLGGRDVGALSLVGLAFALIAMLTYVVGVIMAARLPAHLPPMPRTGFALLVAAVAWGAVAPPWSLPFDRFDDTVAFAGRFGFDVPVWAALAFVALVGSIGVYIAWIVGTSRVGPGAASVVGMSEPVIAGVMAWSLLGQDLAPLQVVGVAVALGAILVVERARLLRRPAAVADAPVDLL